ncbi:pleckstrin homology domain-containing family A member 1-like isoform X2 [Mya arenaria]|uniref:pleckstrin homology domain-containing family A member 1-like isoform X2 n=1 Tax=Mya arenaria TaxID=6604 RepID=UPI0022E2E6B5|nr:pleckstrin homology domain-containing family A member 1-like isoform X2 [Mya arenaria]
MSGVGEKSRELCGFLKVEDSKHQFSKRRFFHLDLNNQTLSIYLDHPNDLPKTCKTNEPYEVIYLNFVSQVSDARKARPKAGYCFCITHTGDQSFYQAENEEQMNKWIEALNEACKITVHDYEVKTTKLAPPNSRNEVAGGVIITTKPENHDSGAESVEHNLPALSLQCYKSGYAVKQGALRKNWKKRYFVLDSNGFSYYKHDQDKEPIKTLPLHEILQARLVAGEHHPHRQNLFEVQTADRTYYVQCEKSEECQKWVSSINQYSHQLSVCHGLEHVNSFTQLHATPKKGTQLSKSGQGRPTVVCHLAAPNKPGTNKTQQISLGMTLTFPADLQLDMRDL